jgi:hypothetical protein
MQGCTPLPGYLHQAAHVEHCTTCALAGTEAVLAVEQLVAEVLPDALVQHCHKHIEIPIAIYLHLQ